MTYCGYRVIIINKGSNKMKKILLVVFIIFVGVGFAAAEGGAWEWKDHFASTTYGVALMPVDFSNHETELSEVLLMPGIDIRLFTGNNVTKRGGFYSGTEIGLITFLSIDEGFEDTYYGLDSGSVTYNVVNSDSFIGTVFALAKYGYRLDLGVSFFGISLGWEMGIGARIASGNFDYSAVIGDNEGSRSEGYDTSAISMMLDTAVEASVRLGTSLRFVAKLGALLTPPLIDIRSNYAGISDPTTDDNAGAIINSYDVESFPVIATGRVGFIISY